MIDMTVQLMHYNQCILSQSTGDRLRREKNPQYINQETKLQAISPGELDEVKGSLAQYRQDAGNLTWWTTGHIGLR